MSQKYIGIKVILATPMNRLDYHTHCSRGWELPLNGDGTDEGYLVEEVDDSPSNHPDHKGCISWVPKDVFERTYVLVEDGREGIMQYFTHEDLPESLVDVSKAIDQLAQIMATLPDGPKKTEGLSRLLEAKECFLRAKLDNS